MKARRRRRRLLCRQASVPLQEPPGSDRDRRQARGLCGPGVQQFRPLGEKQAMAKFAGPQWHAAVCFVSA